MASVIRVMLIVCAVLIVNGLFQLVRVAAKASEKNARRTSARAKAATPKKPDRKAAPPEPAKAAPAPAPALAPKKRGRPRKETGEAATKAAKPTAAPAAPEPAAVEPEKPKDAARKALVPAKEYAWGLVSMSRPYSMAEFAELLEAN